MTSSVSTSRSRTSTAPSRRAAEADALPRQTAHDKRHCHSGAAWPPGMAATAQTDDRAGPQGFRSRRQPAGVRRIISRPRETAHTAPQLIPARLGMAGVAGRIPVPSPPKPWGMTMSNIIRATALLLVAAVATGTPAVAKTKDKDRTWPVTHKLLGKPDKTTGEIKKANDVSGIACTTTHGFPRSCLVIDDNLQAAQFVTLKDGEIVAGKPIRLIDNTYGDDGEPLELDGEGVAYADGEYYVIGSHGRPRSAKKKLTPKEEARVDAASQIVRFSADARGEPGPIARTGRLRDIITTDAAF